MSNCGNKPKVLAIGIAPLGIISIGIVPMGVVSIGVVPMGVLTVGAVAMGVVNLAVVGMGVLVAGVNVMGVWWTGMEGMGPFRLGGGAAAVHRHSPPHQQPHAAAPGQLMAFPSREQALAEAGRLGCAGVHRMGDLWMACAHHPEP